MIGYGGNTTGADTSSSVGVNTANTGYNALSDALKGLGGFSPSGSTQSNIDAATQYANNPATDGMIDAAMRDARRSVSEDVLPQVARSSALTGNTMSSKNALTQGVVERGLADKTADTSANIRGQQFNTGLQLAQQQSAQNDNAMLDALKSSASAGGSAVGTGVGAIGSGIQQAGGLFDIANAGAAGGQQNTQNQINDAKGQDEYANSQLWQNLQNMFGIVGGTGYGSQTTGTTTQTSNPSIWSDIGSVGGALGSLLKLSDRRFKTDIKQIGTADNGLPIYTYRYKGSSRFEIGFMAQDVEAVKPEAVVEISGIKHVNYELASN